jgi:hypothetical protein
MRGILFAILLGLTSCITTSGDKLAEIAPPTAVGLHSFEFGFRDFEYSLDGGALQSSASKATTFNRTLGNIWIRRGYASTVVQCGRNPSSGVSDYTLVLTGNLDGSSSIGLQVLSGLTLMMIPHVINSHAYFVLELKRQQDGAVFKATVAEDVKQVGWLPLILALPWMEAGFNRAVEKMASHAYKQFADQGAFDLAGAASGGG